MEEKESGIVGERFYVNYKTVKRGVNLVVKVRICEGDKRGGAAHPRAQRGYVVSSLLGVVFMAQSMTCPIKHHINMT